MPERMSDRMSEDFLQSVCAGESNWTHFNLLQRCLRQATSISSDSLFGREDWAQMVAVEEATGRRRKRRRRKRGGGDEVDIKFDNLHLTGAQQGRCQRDRFEMLWWGSLEVK